MTVAEVKIQVLEKHWPEGYTSRDKIEKLRFFYQGKEMLDILTIGQINFKTTVKNEEGLIEVVVPAVLVHPVCHGPQVKAQVSHTS